MNINNVWSCKTYSIYQKLKDSCVLKSFYRISYLLALRYIQTFLLDFLVDFALQSISPLTLEGCQSLSLNYLEYKSNIVKFLTKPITAEPVVWLHVSNSSNLIHVFILFLSVLKQHYSKWQFTIQYYITCSFCCLALYLIYKWQKRQVFLKVFYLKDHLYPY